MNELRFVRREERSLILATENDDEFRLVIDDLLISELKHASRKEREGTTRVRPREIQSLVRAGKTRAEIAELTGLEESDIKRYEEPVLAERRYILERAHAVQVRTETSDESNQKFGEVIAERLVGLEAEASEWAAWRDEETGWLISLEFISHDVAHKALWAFDHRKQTLAPVNTDAVNLSKQGEVGDRLIPKLRAVDNRDRTSQFAPVNDAPEAPQTPSGGAAPATPAVPTAAEPPQKPHTPVVTPPPASVAPVAAATPASPTAPGPIAPLDANAEYARRREIDQRAIKSEDSGPVDFSQTADLLDALRRRRGERKLAEAQEPDDTATTPISTPPTAAPTNPASITPQLVPENTDPQASAPAASEPASQAAADLEGAPVRSLKKPRSIWGGAGVASGVTSANQRGAGSGPQAPASPSPSPAAQGSSAPSDGTGEAAPTGDPRAAKKGRASIPSWDDILFGTRSDEDPSA